MEGIRLPRKPASRSCDVVPGAREPPMSGGAGGAKQSRAGVPKVGLVPVPRARFTLASCEPGPSPTCTFHFS